MTITAARNTHFISDVSYSLYRYNSDNLKPAEGKLGFKVRKTGGGE